MACNSSSAESLIDAYMQDGAEKDRCKQYLAAFRDHDADHSGALERDEFINMCQGHMDEAGAQRIFELCDHAGGGRSDGKVSEQEFIVALCASALEIVFNTLDADGSGLLDMNELMSLAGEYKERGYSDAQMQRVFDEWDDDHSDGVSKEEFIKKFCGSPPQ